jgi:hypothetical protein
MRLPCAAHTAVDGEEDATEMGGRVRDYTRDFKLSRAVVSVLPRMPEEDDYSIATNREVQTG